MVAQPCPQCRTPNSTENLYCGSCGAALSHAPLVISAPRPLPFHQPLPPDQVKRIAATLAISLTAVLAEAGLKYLQRRLDDMPAPSLRRKKKAPTAVIPAPPAGQSGQIHGRVITVVSERVIEEKRWGRPWRRVVERFAWRAEEERT